MADLLDIAPATACQSVHIDGKHLIVYGLHGNAIASVLNRFPKIVAALNGRGSSDTIAQFIDAWGPIIAAGCKHLNDEQYEKHAATLPLEDQLTLVTAIVGLTFPNGLISFVNKATVFLTGFLSAAVEREKPVKMRLKQLPSQSLASSAEDSPQTMQ